MALPVFEIGFFDGASLLFWILVKLIVVGFLSRVEDYLALRLCLESVRGFEPEADRWKLFFYYNVVAEGLAVFIDDVVLTFYNISKFEF